jgi:hypothetical protein
MPRRSACLALAAVAWLFVPAPALTSDEAARRVASDFHRRALITGAIAPDAAYAVPLASDVVAALKHGGELRVFDAAGREIPSLVHSADSRGEVIDRPATIFNQAFGEDGTRTLSVELRDRKPQAVNEFVFDLADAEYNARVRVEAGQDGENWQILRDGLHLIRHTVEREKIAYRHNVLRVPTARFRFYRFTLRPTQPSAVQVDAAQEPLEVTGVAVREVVRRGSALALTATLERIDDERDDDSRHHYWKLDLGREHLGVDRVDFTIPATDFARSASLWEWSPERGRRTRQLATSVAFHYDDDVHTEFTGFTTDARVLVMMIDQGDDTPVEVTAARASRPRQQLRFIGPRVVEAPLALYLDPDESREPRYDLARRLSEHEITSFEELRLEPLEPNPGYAKPPEARSEQIPFLLYALVLPLVAGLGWYIVRTIQRGVPPEEPPPHG